MRIGFFTNTYLPIPYGASSSIEYFRKGLEQLGHEVFVFAPHYSGYTDESERVIRYPSIQWKYKMKYPIAFSWYPPLWKQIDEIGFDIIHSHQPFSIGKDGFRQARRLGVPVVFTHHCRYEDYIHYVPVIPKRLLIWYVNRQATNFANACDQVISPSQEIKQMIQHRGVTQDIKVIPTGIDTGKYLAARRDEIRKQYGIAASDICLSWIGRMEKEKNLEFLMKAAIQIIKRHPEVKLMLVGDGSERGMLSEMVKRASVQNSVIFTGIIRKDIQDYFSAGDIFLQSSITETQGMATTEALAAGQAVVAVKATGSESQIESGVSGILTDHDNEEFITEIEKLIMSPEKRKELGKHAKERAKAFDYLTKCMELVGVYEALLNRVKN